MWFWKAGQPFLDGTELWQHYLWTVGRGAGLMINLPPDRDGVISAGHAREAARLGAAVAQLRAPPVARLTAVTLAECDGGSASTVTLQLPPGAGPFNLVSTREDLASGGQRIANYTLQLLSAGRWAPVAGRVHGGTVGRRVLDAVPEGEVAGAGRVEAVRFVCLRAVALPVRLRELGVHYVVPPT